MQPPPASTLLQLLLLPLSLMPVARSNADLTVPDWEWEPDRAQVGQHCLSVPNVTGMWYNESVTWTNNSRLLSVAVPKGTPPPGGWPVMVDLLVIDYPSLFGEPSCGLDGYENPQTRQYPASKACQALGKRLCGDKLHTNHYECTSCFSQNRTELLTVCEKMEIYVLEKQCPVEPPPVPLNKSCTKALSSMCNWTFSIPDNSPDHRMRRHNCSMCVSEAQHNLTMGGANGCPHASGAPHSSTWNESAAAARRQILMDFCFPDKRKPGGGMGQHVRDFGPFVSPQRLAMGCSCINGSDSKFRCSPPYDDDQHGHPFVPPGGFCSFDVFAGGLWSQRLKQYLLNNGIAIVEANNYVQDGWESWDDEWEGGYDAMFFKQFAKAMQGGGSIDAPAGLSNLNPHRMAFRGWSGSAQMVSWLINQDARGKLPGLKVRAGVMMAGGSHACYNWPGHGAINNCANCNASEAYTHDPNAFGCSSTAAERGVVGGEPYCELCCPTNYTEDYYNQHPEKYSTHPPTFLIQTELDSGADSCAAKHYHETMLAHGAHSELGIVPLDQQRCFSIGNPGDPAVPKEDTFQRFCKDPNTTSLNHTQGFAGAVEPITRFLIEALGVQALRVVDETEAR